MKEYKREYPLFSLCGLNCGLCPRFHTEGGSRCPGCGGGDFYCKRGGAGCPVITCSRKHNNVEFCFECGDYPCERYLGRDNTGDSFITYKNVLRDCDKAKTIGISAYKAELDEKAEILRFLLKECNDGRRKNFYCIAVNLLELSDIRKIMNYINTRIALQDILLKEKIKMVVEQFEKKAAEKDIVLKLRKGKA